MTEINRRNFIARAVASTAGLLLAGCDRLSRTEGFVEVLTTAEKLNYHVHHLVTARTSLPQEFSEPDLSPTFRSNGTANPNNVDYQALAANGFAEYRLTVTGLVEDLVSGLTDRSNLYRIFIQSTVGLRYAVYTRYRLRHPLK